MSAVASLPTSRIAGLNVAIADLGLVRGYVCIAAGDQPLKYVELKEARSAIAFCQKQDHWPPADHIFCHDAPGELPALIAHFNAQPSANLQDR
jgi:hypothetical protein